MKVLIVDDNTMQRRILRASLAYTDHEIIEARDGRAAWELIQHESVQLIITDWMMPEMNGLELIRRIREAEFPAYLYIILVTARDSKTDVIQGLESGADDYLTKPFERDELRARIAIGERIVRLEARLRDSMEQLRIVATHDGLTGLLNRAAIYERTHIELERSRRERFPLSLILLDIDHFKAVNDSHGHLIGDKALRMVAQTITWNKRRYDLAGRWGGEEFLLIMPETTLEEAGIIAERMRQSVANARLPLPDGTFLCVEASLGVTNVPAGVAIDLDMLLQQADEALYCAKKEGRNRVCLAEVTLL